MDAQKLKARELADRGRCVQNPDGSWFVFSLTSTSKYRVILNAMDPQTCANTKNSCTCPSFVLRQDTCKHIRAVLSVIAQDIKDRANGLPPREYKPEGEPRKHKKPTYRQPNWAAYTAAQCNQKGEFLCLLSDLCSTIAEPERKPGKGRPPVPLTAQVFGACYKVFSGMSGRRFMTDMRDAHDKGFVSEPVHFNAIARFFEDEGNTPLLRELVTQSALPLKGLETKFAVDSSGFSGCKFDRWYDQKYGRMQQEHVWVKCHAMTGVTTNCFASAEVLEQDSGDNPNLPPLVKKTATGFRIDQCSADKAYGSSTSFDAIAAAGGTGYIAFKVNTTGEIGGLFQEMYHKFCLEKEEYLRCYHLRSNIESSFSAVKRLFGDSVRSKTDTAMRNEVYAKLICYNLVCIIHTAYELNIELGIFDSESRSELNVLKFPGY